MWEKAIVKNKLKIQHKLLLFSLILLRELSLNNFLTPGYYFTEFALFFKLLLSTSVKLKIISKNKAQI